MPLGSASVMLHPPAGIKSHCKGSANVLMIVALDSGALLEPIHVAHKRMHRTHACFLAGYSGLGARAWSSDARINKLADSTDIRDRSRRVLDTL